MNNFWDDDIENLQMPDEEKNGLQVFRNYKKAFNEHAEKVFSEELNEEPFDIVQLERFLSQLETADVRFVPVITCAYIDDLLKLMFKKEIPDGVPGGKLAMFGSYGPLSDLSKRLQLAYAFDMVSSDILIDLNRIRRIRNDLSHSWDVGTFDSFFSEGNFSEIYPIEMLLSEQLNEFADLSRDAEPLELFRLRVVWVVARFKYEAAFYSRAKRKRLDPHSCLFGERHTMWLTEVSRVAMGVSRLILSKS